MSLSTTPVICWRGVIEEITVEEAKTQFETNFFGVVRVLKKSAAHQAQTGKRSNH